MEWTTGEPEYGSPHVKCERTVMPQFAISTYMIRLNETKKGWRKSEVGRNGRMSRNWEDHNSNVLTSIASSHEKFEPHLARTLQFDDKCNA